MGFSLGVLGRQIFFYLLKDHLDFPPPLSPSQAPPKTPVIALCCLGLVLAWATANSQQPTANSPLQVPKGNPPPHMLCRCGPARDCPPPGLAAWPARAVLRMALLSGSQWAVAGRDSHRLPPPPRKLAFWARPAWGANFQLPEPSGGPPPVALPRPLPRALPAHVCGRGLGFCVWVFGADGGSALGPTDGRRGKPPGQRF